MGKKKAILTTLGAVGAIAATGGLASIGIPGLIGGSAAGGAAGAVHGVDALVGSMGARAGMSIGTKLALGAAAAQAATGIYGAHAQTRSADRSADLTTAAADRAAERQDAAAQRAEALQRQIAENAYRNDEAARRGNYEQWAATEGRRGSIGAMLGLGPRNIPAYVPGVDPGFDGGGATSGTMPVDGRPPLTRVDQFGRGPSDPLYGTPVPSPRARKLAPPDVSVGVRLQSPTPVQTPSTTITGPDGTVYDRATGEVIMRAASASLRGTPGSVGSYLRSA